MTGRIVFAAFLVSCFSTSVLACNLDTDCDIGNKCIRQPAEQYGVCAGGLDVGNDRNRGPDKPRLDVDGVEPKSCSTNQDCGVSGVCYQEPGSVGGVCVKKR